MGVFKRLKQAAEIALEIDQPSLFEVDDHAAPGPCASG